MRLISIGNVTGRTHDVRVQKEIQSKGWREEQPNGKASDGKHMGQGGSKQRVRANKVPMVAWRGIRKEEKLATPTMMGSHGLPKAKKQKPCWCYPFR
jgi:hypothetical protein